MTRTAPATKTRVFISFDYDHDNDLKALLLGQAKKHDTPFSFEDWSIKQETKNWKEDARKRIRRSDVVVVVCGLHTYSAVGVAAEVKIAREEGVPFWLLRARNEGTCQRPRGTAWPWNPIHDWTWEGIESMCRYVTLPWWKRMW